MIEPAQVYARLNLSDPTDSQRQTVLDAINISYGAIKRFLHYDPVLKVHTIICRNQDLRSRGYDTTWDANNSHAFQRYATTNKSDELQLQHMPIRNVGAGSAANPVVYVENNAKNDTQSGAFSGSSRWTEGVDYWADYDLIDDYGARVSQDAIMRSNRWPSETGAIKITYWAGYTCDEFRGAKDQLDASPIMESWLIETIRRVKQVLLIDQFQADGTLQLGAYESENLGDYGYKIAGGGGSGSMLDNAYGNKRGLLQQSEMLLESFVNYGWSAFS